MAKRTLDFGDYREPDFEEYTGEDPPPGKWFLARATRGKYLKEDDQVQVILEIIDGDYKGWGRAVYCDFEGDRKFVFQELVKALQGGKAQAVTIDWENDTAINNWLKKQKPIKIQTREYNDKTLIGKTRANLEAVPTGANSPAPSPSQKLEAVPEDPEGDGGDEDYTEEELEAMEASELVAILTEEFELGDEDLPQEPSKPRRDPDGSKYAKALEDYKDKLIEAVLDEQDGDDGDAEGDDTDGTDGGGDGFDDGFANDPEPEPEPEPEPAKPARRARKAAAPAPEPAPAASTRTRRSRR